MDTYKRMETLLSNALNDLAILSGDIVGPSDVSWQDVAGTASCNLICLANLLDDCRNGHVGGPIVFPSPSEVMEKIC